MSTTEEKIAVMQAHVDGKKIDCCFKSSEDWFEDKSISWDWGAYDYRVKPEPREAWVTQDPKSKIFGSVFHIEKHAKSYAKSSGMFTEVIKFVQAIE